MIVLSASQRVRIDHEIGDLNKSLSYQTGVNPTEIQSNSQLVDFKRGQGCILQLSFLVNFDVRRNVGA